MKLSCLLFLLNLSCSLNNNSAKSDSTLSNKNNLTAKETAFIAADSSIFKKQKATSSELFLLNEDGVLNIDSLSINISLKENEKDKYDLQIFKNGKSIFTEKDVEGISKIFINEQLLMFSIFSTFTEDGTNEGKAFAYDWAKNEILINKEKLTNTCNPVFLNGNFYLIDNLRLIQLDRNFNFIKATPVYFKANSDDYLDSFLICSLNTEKKELIINFSPQKSSLPCVGYKGYLSSFAKKIILLN